MGNPNRRAPKKDFIANSNRPVHVPGPMGLDGTTSPVLSTQPLGAIRKVEEQIRRAKSDSVGSATGQGGNMSVKSDNQRVAEIISPQPRRIATIDGLPFKSHANGTLRTTHFEPSGKVLAPLPESLVAALPEPFPPPKRSPLNATSPEFVPAAPANRLSAPSDPQTPPQSAGRGPGGFHGRNGNFNHRQQNNHNLSMAAGPVHYQGNRSHFNHHQRPMQLTSQVAPASQLRPGINAAPALRPTHQNRPEINVPPQFHNMMASQTPTIKRQKKDFARKDIIISAYGVARNIVEVVQRSLPNGISVSSANPDQKGIETDALVWLAGMDGEKMKKELRKNWVEIIIPMQSQEDEQKFLEEAKLSGTSPTILAEAKPKAVPVLPKIIQVLQSLPAAFFENVTKMNVTLCFPDLVYPSIPTGPSADQQSSSEAQRALFSRGNSTHTISSSPSTYSSTANFVLLTQFCVELNKFSALTRLEIVLGTPSNMRTPMTLPQLNCFLPFYDLEFTNWQAKWQAGFMKNAETVRGWPLSYCNGERDKIVNERVKIQQELKKKEEKDLNEVKVIRKSAAPAPIDISAKKGKKGSPILKAGGGDGSPGLKTQNTGNTRARAKTTSPEKGGSSGIGKGKRVAART